MICTTSRNFLNLYEHTLLEEKHDVFRLTLHFIFSRRWMGTLVSVTTFDLSTACSTWRVVGPYKPYCIYFLIQPMQMYTNI